MKFDFERQAADHGAFMAVIADMYDDADEAAVKAEIKEVAEWCNSIFVRANWEMTVRRDINIGITFDELGQMQEHEQDRWFTVYFAFQQ